MAKRRKQTTLFGEIAYRLSVLAGLAGFIGGIFLFDSPDSDQTMLYAAFLGGGAMFGTSVLLLMLRSAVSTHPKSNRIYDFDESAATRLQPATEFSFEESTMTKQQLATQFEYDVAQLIQRLTGKRTEVVGGSGDGGIDINVYNDNGRLVGIVQCKHLQENKTVYPAYIRDLNTVRHYHHVNIAYLVTTGRFSNESYQLANDLGVRLIDGNRLQQLQQQVSGNLN